MIATDVVNEYVAIINKLEELRLLLKKKLIQLKAIDSSGLIDDKNVTFPKLLTKVNPTDIDSIINKQLPNQPIDLTDDFVTDFKINGSFNSQYSIEDFNSLLIDKFNFYREYLMYQLENMGVSKNEINQAITIKNLILLLDKVNKVRTIDDITCDDTTIYINQNNIIDVDIYDEIGAEVKKGTLEIYENGTCIYSKNIGEKVIITPTTIGEHTYNFKYVNKDKNTNATINKYITSELFPITIDVIYSQLEGSFTLQNTTTTSEYYTGNEDDFIGYENDKWDIDVNIFDINQNSINQTIPFNIYMHDDQHLVTSGITDATGHVKLTNITIPYTNSDFIDFRESAVTRYSYDSGLFLSSNRSTLSFADVEMEASDENNPGKAIIKAKIYQDGEPIEGQQVSFYITDEQQNNVVTTDDIDELSFIKSPTFIDGKLTYKRVTFTENNYLDNLNGCIINIQQNGTSIQYTTFSTSEHTKLSEINNLSETIGHLVTEVFYKTKTINDVVTITELGYETLVNKKYIYDKESPDYSVPLILKTTLDDPTYPNAELYHDIIIYHIPLFIDDQNLTWYKTDPNIPVSIPIVLCDREIGEELPFINENYKLKINNTNYTVTSTIYDYYININNLPYGDTNLNIILYENDKQITVLNKKITLLSNFELPTKNKYFANDTPDIYYKPKGIAKQSQKVQITTNYNNLNGNYYTQSNGLIHGIKDWITPRVYNLTLKAASQGLTEERSFSYEIKKPFNIEQIYYKKTEKIEYQITIYDNEHINFNNFTSEEYIQVTNANNETVSYLSTISQSNNQLNLIITILASETNGTNTLTVNINNYTESYEFKLYERLFEIQTEEITLGNNKEIQIICYDPTIDSISITGNGIQYVSSSSALSSDGKYRIFTIICNITQAGERNITITNNSNIDDTETRTITVLKGNINCNFTITSSNFNYGEENIKISVDISPTPTSEQIQLIYNDGGNIITPTYNISSTSIHQEYNVNTNKIGTYTATLIFNGNNNYNSFSKSLTYTIGKLNPTLTINQAISGYTGGFT